MKNFIAITKSCILFLLIVHEANALPKDLDVGKILLEKNLILRSLGIGNAIKVEKDNNMAVMQSKSETQNFDAQYKKPRECYDIRDSETQMKCTNTYIRARKAFNKDRGK